MRENMMKNNALGTNNILEKTTHWKNNVFGNKQYNGKNNIQGGLKKPTSF